MDPAQITTPSPHTSINTPVPGGSNKFQNLSPKNILLFLIIIIFVIGGVFYGVTNVKNSTSTKKEEVSQDHKEVVNLAPYTLVYGSWTDKNSVILAYDLSTGKEGVLAQLPVNIKKVSVLDNNTLLYIAQTDVRDQGRIIAKYDLSKKQETTLLTASEGFGIDDYVLSPDKKYISLWEVKVNDDSGILLGGKSRVYTANLTNPQTKNLITDENSTEDNPVKYPRGILNNGTVFMDRFLPNSGTGWAYGMSMSNFTGTEQKDIESMPNGTYGTQPTLSPDGKYFVFQGYTGTQGDGAANVNGFRRSIVSSNQVQLLNTQTLQRESPKNLPLEPSFGRIGWDKSGTGFYVSVLSDSKLETGIYYYSLQTNNFSLVSPFNPDLYFVSTLDTNEALFAKQLESSNSLGNLGGTYSAPYTDMYFVDLNKGNQVDLNLTGTLIQYIGVLPSKFLGSNILQPIDSAMGSGNTLQLQTFTVKSELAQERRVHQSQPEEVTRQTNNVTGEKTVINTPKGAPKPNNTGSLDAPNCKDFKPTYTQEKCGTLTEENNLTYGQCSKEAEREMSDNSMCEVSSPLYLYGKTNTLVTITIHTPFANSVPFLNSKTFQAVLKENGNFSIDNNKVPSLAFSYTPAIKKIVYPKNGIITSQKELTKNIDYFAKNLGLNEKETADLLDSAKKSITSPYAFISFFDHETSHAILPITFNPKPDIYRNIVFYFKNLDQKPNFSIQPPTFHPIIRHGFTAIEISEIVE